MAKKILSVMMSLLIICASFSVMTSVFAVEETEKLVGDADLDGKLTTLDALAVLKSAAGIDGATLSEEARALCDINHDGNISLYDARQILKGAVGIIKLQPSGAFKGFDGGDAFATKAELVEYFNSHLNNIKAVRAGFTKTTKTDVSNVSIEGAKALGFPLSNIDSVISGIIDKITEGEKDSDAIEYINYGASGYMGKFPVEGETYVSALTEADVFGASAVVDAERDIITIKIALADTDYKNVKESSYSKAFNTDNMVAKTNDTLTKVLSSLESDEDNVQMKYQNGVLTAVIDTASGNVISYDTSYESYVYVKSASYGTSKFNLIDITGLEYLSKSGIRYDSFIWS